MTRSMECDAKFNPAFCVCALLVLKFMYACDVASIYTHIYLCVSVCVVV